MANHEKPTSETRSVSAHPEMFAKADARVAEGHFATFSDYVRHLIRLDLNGQLHVRRNGEPATAAQEEGQR